MDVLTNLESTLRTDNLGASNLDVSLRPDS